MLEYLELILSGKVSMPKRYLFEKIEMSGIPNLIGGSRIRIELKKEGEICLMAESKERTKKGGSIDLKF